MKIKIIERAESPYRHRNIFARRASGYERSASRVVYDLVIDGWAAKIGLDSAASAISAWNDYRQQYKFITTPVID